MRAIAAALDMLEKELRRVTGREPPRAIMLAMIRAWAILRKEVKPRRTRAA
jgi:hypothetical protein